MAPADRRIGLKLRKLAGHGAGRALRALRARALHRPTTLVLDTSHRCNLSCRMCSLPGERRTGVMSMDTFERLAHVFPQVASVELHSSGEPLLNPHLVEMVRRIKAISPAAAVEFSTNGMLVDGAIARALVDAGLDRITFSVDGATPETYAAVRRGADLERVLAGVDAVVAASRAARATTPYVAFAFVAMASNIDELPALVDLAAEHGASVVAVNGLEPYSEDMQAQVLYWPDNARCSARFGEAAERARSRGVTLVLPETSKSPVRRCPASRVAMVSWDGEVPPCPILSYERDFYDEGRRMSHQRLSFGNVAGRDLLEIWDEADYSGFRERTRRQDFPDPCAGCLLSYGVICPM